MGIINAIVWNNRIWKENKQLAEENGKLWKTLKDQRDRIYKVEDDYEAMLEMYNELSNKYDTLLCRLNGLIELAETTNASANNILSELKKEIGS
jgi:CRISPR/Cas system-associated endonuclease Cas3-HD